MSVKQFHHFMCLQQRITGVRRPARRTARTSVSTDRTAAAVIEAKEWLAGAKRRR